MARIAYFVHGRGRGHASRSRPILDTLRQRGHDLSLFGGGHAADLLGADPSFRECEPVLPGVAMIPTTARRVRHDLGALRALSPAVVVSDGDMPSLLAARRLGIPSLAVGHDLVFTRCHLPEGLPRRHLMYQAVNTWASAGLPDRGVAVHFLPAVPRDESIRIARPDLREDLRGPRADQGFFLAYFRDRNGTGVLKTLVERGRRVVCFGGLDEVPSGVEAAPFDAAAFARHLRNCTAVVGSSGSNLISESVLLGKPMLALYRKNDAEQALNALLADRAGAAISCPFESASDAVVDELLRRVDGGAFRTLPLIEQMAPASRTVAATIADMVG